ncbi:hypothetical protein ABZT02_14260 [Streptomyces sp. NPDC005402]|uniref:hypothetical protein n=1 Tax=Streptomyces sp. NPDC005402 TaxID=3155338 RepID=UPI0033A7B902
MADRSLAPSRSAAVTARCGERAAPWGGLREGAQGGDTGDRQDDVALFVVRGRRILL